MTIALSARSACAAMVSWQNVQQKRMLRYRERAREEVPLVFGLNSVQQIATEPYPSQASTPRKVRDGELGGYRYLHLIPDEPHELDDWWVSAFLCALFEPQQTVTVRAPAPYRARRPLSRSVRVRAGRRETWSIARAVPIETWAYQPYVPGPDDILVGWFHWVSQPKELPIWFAPEPAHGIFHRRFRPLSHIHVELKKWPIFVSHGSSMEDCRGVAPRSTTDKVTVQRGRINDGVFVPDEPKRVCHPARIIALPPVRKPYGLLPPFTRLGPILWIGPLKHPSKQERERWKNARIFLSNKLPRK